MEMTRNNRFLRWEYIKVLIPVMFSVLAGTINTLIDSAFIAQKLGSSGLAAVNMCSPLYQFICTLGSLLAGGASLLSARQEGKNDAEKSRACFHTALLLCVITGLVFSGAGMALCRPFSVFLAQHGALAGYVYDYCFVTFIGLVPIAFAYIPLYYMQLAGRTREIIIMMGIVIGTDILFDWMFLYVFDFRLSGAAAASVISMALSCIYGMYILQKHSDNYRVSFRGFRLRGFRLRGWREIVKFGSPAALGNFLDALRLFLLNALILRVGGETAIALWAVLNTFSELSLSIVSGVPQAASPMLGVFYAARENSGIRILMKLQVKTGMLLLAVYTLILAVFHREVEELFALQQMILLPLLCLGVSLFFDLLCGIWGSFFNAVGQILLSNLLMVGRTFVFPLATVLILIWRRSYLWLFLPVGNILTVAAMLAVTGWLALRTKNTIRPLSPILLLDDHLEKEGLVLDFSVSPAVDHICEASDRIKEFCIKNEMSTRSANRLGLAIEELLVVMKENNPRMKSTDLRFFVEGDSTGIQIRSQGDKYDPFETAAHGEDDFYMGIRMLQRLAEKITYSYTLGMNTIYLSFCLRENEEGIRK